MFPGLEPVAEPVSTVTVPADLAFLSVLRLAIAVITDSLSCDGGCSSDLQLATDEFAAVLIRSGSPDSSLEMSVRDDDDDDVYIRMCVEASDEGLRERDLGLTRMLLDETVDSYDVGVHGHEIVAVIQRQKSA